MTDPVQRRILYFADPMCSWCWGFAPVIAALAGACEGVVPIRLCVGGLRPFTTEPMRARDKAFVRHHWETVAAETGQPFDFAFFEREAFVYDTEPACRAAVAVRGLAPEVTLRHLAALQRAFYAENRDVTRADALAEVAAAFVARHDFEAVFGAEEAREATLADFRLAKRLGIGGFPTVVLVEDNRAAVLSAGWQPFAALEQPLRAWLAGDMVVGATG
ncbi:MAG: DsbA family protein [Defluviicoccus sp.]